MPSLPVMYCITTLFSQDTPFTFTGGKFFLVACSFDSAGKSVDSLGGLCDDNTG